MFLNYVHINSHNSLLHSYLFTLQPAIPRALVKLFASSLVPKQFTISVISSHKKLRPTVIIKILRRKIVKREEINSKKTNKTRQKK